MVLETPEANTKEWDSPLYREAVSQFESVAEIVNLDSNVRDRLRTPQRALVVTFPFAATSTRRSTRSPGIASSTC